MIEGAGAASGLRFAVIRSRFNEDVTKRLLEGALDALRTGGARDESIDVVVVPGAFEIPLIAAKLARSRRYDALICLGAVIRGETPHFDYISAEVSRGVARAAYDYGLPVIFGVLTADTDAQADARSGKGGPNRGYEAAVSAIEMANLMKRLDGHSGSTRRGHVRTTKRPSSKRTR
ncbi:MAG: 6,7-dimethyl-8-ribityllumazine synthase [Nitrospirae bacterium]|nr:MAG: 6,7-dimethyl-8-ribityllumazine synthase [Nitrospirota bacterium]